MPTPQLGASTNIFHGNPTAADLAAQAASERPSRGGRPLRTLSQAIGTSLVGIVDSVDISSAARVAASIAQKNATLTNSNGSPGTVRPVHPVIDGTAAINGSSKAIAGR